jgi:molybdenum cofactor cytidylyltransferase
MIQPAPYAVVLAAGAGTRFGGEKLLAPLHGKPLVAHVALALARAVAAGDLGGGVAVLPPGDTRLSWHLDAAGLTPIVNPEAATGVSSSLRRGIAALEDPSLDPPAGAALIVLADQPLLSPGTIAQLVRAWRERRRSIRPRYADHPSVPGHPVLLDRAAWRMTRDLHGDEGFGLLFRAQPGLVDLLDLPGDNPDVDRPEDLHLLEETDG